MSDYYDTNFNTVLYWAVKNNYSKVVEALLYEKTDITLEMIGEAAAHFDNINILKYVIFLGLKPTFEMMKVSCHSGSTAVFSFLYQKCYNMLTREDTQELIKNACSGNQMSIVRQLMTRYPNILKNHWWKLIYLCQDGHLEMVKLLVEEGDADIHQDNNYSVLCAIKNGHFDLTQYLVSRGAHVFAQGDYAIEHVERGDTKMVNYLLELGANKEKIPKWFREKQVSEENFTLSN